MRLSDYRRIARERLSGKWLLTIAVAFIASLLGGSISTSPTVSFEFNTGSSSNTALDSFQNDPEALSLFITVMMVVAIGVLIVFLVGLAVEVLFCSVIRVGYSQYLLNLVDNKNPDFKDLFSQFFNYKGIVLTELRRTLTILLGMLLFIVPGIIWSYDYAMVHFIMADHPEYSPRECMNASKVMMYGHRWEYFLLGLSFIGWALLCCLTCGLGGVVLVPYQDTSFTVFYRNISGTLAENPVAPVVDAE